MLKTSLKITYLLGLLKNLCKYSGRSVRSKVSGNNCFQEACVWLIAIMVDGLVDGSNTVVRALFQKVMIYISEEMRT